MAAHTFRSDWASRSGHSSVSAGDGMDGASAGASTVEFSSADIPMHGEAPDSTTTRHLCTATIAALTEAVLEHAALADAVMLRAQQEAFRAAEATGPTAAMPQTGAMQELTEAMKAGRQQAHAQSLPTAGRREDTPPVETLGGGPTHTAAAMPAVGVGIAAEAIDDSDAI